MKRFFVFLIYSFLFLCLGGSVISYYLEYSPFSCFSWTTGEVFVNPFYDWYRLYKLFEFGNWAVDSTENLVIFLTFLLFFPLWILVWFLLCRVRWKKLISKRIFYFKSHKVSTPSTPVVVKNTTGRPIAMRKMRGFGGVAVMATDTQEQKNVPAETNSTATTSVATDSMEAPSGVVNAIQKEQLRALGEKYGYDLFEGVRLDDYEVPFVFATDTTALVSYVLLDNREWIADETPSEEGSEPTWFSSEGLITSPFWQMVQASNLLREKEPDSQIFPVVVVAAGNVLNASSVEEQWKDKGGFVVLWDKGQGEGLSTLEELLSKKAQEETGNVSTDVGISVEKTADFSAEKEVPSENL